jgi:hypothetical protein
MPFPSQVYTDGIFPSCRNAALEIINVPVLMSFMIFHFKFRRKKPEINQAFPFSSFPTLVLTRSGYMGIISGSLQNHPRKRE